MIDVYGIKNCDTMKKTFKFLDAAGVDYIFHDYKKSGFDAAVIKRAIEMHGWEVVINKRGTTWRKLEDNVKNTMDAAAAVETAAENPSLLKRPLVVFKDQILIGYDEEALQALIQTT